MIYCPFCGHSLQQRLYDGISSCSNCCRIFDSSQKNRLLSAAWCIRHLNLETKDLLNYNQLTSVELEFLEKYVFDKGYSHDELLKVLKTETVNNLCVPL